MDIIVTFGELQAGVKEWTEHNFPNNVPWMPLLGVGEELGELNHAFLKMSQGIRGTEEEHLSAMNDAVGDIIIYLADFCNRTGMNIGRAVNDAWTEASQRDWIKYPKDGVSE